MPQVKQGYNNVPQNTPIDPSTGYAEIGDAESTVILSLDRYGHVVQAGTTPIPNIPNGQITLSGDPNDVVCGDGQSRPMSSMDYVGRLMFKGDGGLIYNGLGELLLKGAS
jgi:hypothetical protein